MNSDKGYIIIGNFKTEHDETLDKIFNFSSGLSEANFHALIAQEAQILDCKIDFITDDSVALVGSEQDFKSLRRSIGNRFSFSFTDKVGYEAFLNAEKAALDEMAIAGPAYNRYSHMERVELSHMDA